LNKLFYLLFFILTLSFGCADFEDQEVKAVPIGSPPDQELFDYVTTETEDGAKKWVLTSDKLQKFADMDDVQLFELKMEFFDNDELTSTITSRRGKVNLDSGKLFAWNEVVVISEDGRKLETEELHYDDENGLIVNDVFDRFTRGSDVMTGYGMEATPELDYFELKDQVKAFVVSEDDQKEPAE